MTRWIAAAGVFVVSLDSMVNIAFPAMATAFALPPDAMRWVIMCYVLIYSLVSFAGGALAGPDRPRAGVLDGARRDRRRLRPRRERARVRLAARRARAPGRGRRDDLRDRARPHHAGGGAVGARPRARLPERRHRRGVRHRSHRVGGAPRIIRLAGGVRRADPGGARRCSRGHGARCRAARRRRATGGSTSPTSRAYRSFTPARSRSSPMPASSPSGSSRRSIWSSSAATMPWWAAPSSC